MCLYFNSRPSARGDWNNRSAINGTSISIHAPPRGATDKDCVLFRLQRISIHAPPRGATPTASLLSLMVSFQFTPLREGRRACPNIRAHTSHFNSRPSARGDRTFRLYCHCTKISIHAPPRGATHPAQAGSCPELISIHAPPRGATYAETYPLIVTGNFNSRPSARGDIAFLLSSRNPRISIHAPPRGATGCPPCHITVACDFNSRPSARGDFRLQRDYHGALISIHAPPRGATAPSPDPNNYKQISIHAPPRGATLSTVSATAHASFQFTPLREGRQDGKPQQTGKETFQFTPLREGRRNGRV